VPQDFPSTSYRGDHAVAVIIAIGANADERRKVLGIAVEPSQGGPFWTMSLRSLTARGVRGVKLMISKGHEGLKILRWNALVAGFQAGSALC